MAAGATLAVFARLLVGPTVYLQYDDEKNYLEVRQLQPAPGEALESVRWILSQGVILGVYEPAAMLVKMGWTVASGGGGAAVCFRVNAVLHAVNTAGALLLTLSYPPGSGSGDGPAWLVCVLLSALAFGVHPLRVEVLCWASCQPYLLAGFWSLVALGTHGRRGSPPTQVSQNGYLLSRRGRSVPANASGFDTHRDPISSRFDCRWWRRLAAAGAARGHLEAAGWLGARSAIWRCCWRCSPRPPPCRSWCCRCAGTSNGSCGPSRCRRRRLG
jgi:hypothetical protein